MPAWLASAASKVIMALLIALAIAGALVARSCSLERTAKAETKLGTGQAAAAAASGQDAVNTVGNRMEADAGTDAITRENQGAIWNTPGADAPVAPAVRDVGLKGLCRYAAYKGDPQCAR